MIFSEVKCYLKSKEFRVLNLLSKTSQEMNITGTSYLKEGGSSSRSLLWRSYFVEVKGNFRSAEVMFENLANLVFQVLNVAVTSNLV